MVFYTSPKIQNELSNNIPLLLTIRLYSGTSNIFYSKNKSFTWTATPHFILSFIHVDTVYIGHLNQTKINK